MANGRVSPVWYLFSGVYEQQRRRPACTSAQTDQHLCYSLLESIRFSLATCEYITILASLCSWASWFWVWPGRKSRRRVFLQWGPCDMYQDLMSWLHNRFAILPHFCFFKDIYLSLHCVVICLRSVSLFTCHFLIEILTTCFFLIYYDF